MTNPVFITRVALRNYKSIKACDVCLRPLTYLVGPNGSGKSNFLDALRFVADAVQEPMDNALLKHGGIENVRRRSGGHPTHFSIKLYFTERGGRSGHYGFEIVAQKPGGFHIRREECTVHGLMEQDAFFIVENGELISTSLKTPPASTAGRLFLLSASGSPDFREVYENLSRMAFYNLNPEEIKKLQSPGSGEILARDGGNIASVVRNLKKDQGLKGRIEDFLRAVVPGIENIDSKTISGHNKEGLEFYQKVQGQKHPWQFPSASMSDGTLRALGVLVALFQGKAEARYRIPLVGIEEPEAALHPAAAGILRDALNEASESVQVLVTSHSPDLLDDESISEGSVLAVRSEEGTTIIAPLDRIGREAMKEKLYTAGELLRMDQLSPDPDYKPESVQDSLFDKEEC
ncbi:MAG: chromosome segregation protein SMC [Alphaproteobacteria bacterium]|nr:chromosome segregation protein SMC [Alphaproteobacteria bacterium]